MRKISISILLLLGSFTLIAQSDSTEMKSLVKPFETGAFPKKPNEVLYSFKVSGVYRFFGTHTQQKKDYFLDQTGVNRVLKRNLFIGDDSQLPNLMLNFSGRPSKKTSWGFDLYAFQFLDGNFKSTYGAGQVSNQARPTVYAPLQGTRLAQNLGLLLGINLYGDFETDLGVFSVKTGGIHWTSISDLTLKGFTGYNRYSLFERNPWDPITSSGIKRYSSYFAQGNINQDTRWGQKAFVGTILEASKLPGQFDLKLLYGKTELNGGFLTIPNLSFGGQVKKTNANGFIAINSFSNQTYMDSLAQEGIGFNIGTFEWRHSFDKKVELHTELGMGRYFSPLHVGEFGEALNLKIGLTKKVVKIPFELHFYRISPKVINNNAIFFNSAIVEANNTKPAGTVGSTALLQPFASALTAIGQFTNNRQGLNINTEFSTKNLKLSLANGIGAEIEALSNQISYSHPVNGLTRSRFWRWNFPSAVGPYGRYNVIYRDVYELLELDSAVQKKFNVLEFQVKYHTKFLQRDLYVFMLNRYSSVQDFLAPTTVFTEKAYLRHYSNELEVYYALTRRFTLVNYLGFERMIANYDTERDVSSLRPRNQEGLGYAIGFDLDIARNTSFYFRHRWFSFEDRSFALDAFNGTETVFELKLSF